MRAPLLLALSLLSACASSQNPNVVAPERDRKRDTQVLQARLDDATRLVEQLGGKVPPRLAERAQCAVILPAALRGGVLIGARHGQGFAVCRVNGGLSGPAPVTMSGAAPDFRSG